MNFGGHLQEMWRKLKRDQKGQTQFLNIIFFHILIIEKPLQFGSFKTSGLEPPSGQPSCARALRHRELGQHRLGWAGWPICPVGSLRPSTRGAPPPPPPQKASGICPGGFYAKTLTGVKTEKNYKKQGELRLYIYTYIYIYIYCFFFLDVFPRYSFVFSTFFPGFL